MLLKTKLKKNLNHKLWKYFRHIQQEIIQLSAIKGTDAVAKVNPLMTTIEFDALKLSIRDNGLQVPIILCRGLVIDGRNRLRALEELGYREVDCYTLPRNTSIKIKIEVVNMAETRRHQTPTQKACTAVTCWNTETLTYTQKEFVAQKGVPIANFANAQWLYKNNRQIPLNLPLSRETFFYSHP